MRTHLPCHQPIRDEKDGSWTPHSSKDPLFRRALFHQSSFDDRESPLADSNDPIKILRGVDNAAPSEIPVLRSTELQDFSDVPLLDLFSQRRDHCGESSRKPDRSRGSLEYIFAATGGSYTTAQDLLLQIPNSQELLIVLQAGQALMGLWGKTFADDLENTRHKGAERVRDLIYRNLHSGDAVEIAKTSLTLALHIQQLPNDFNSLSEDFCNDVRELQGVCIRAADSILTSGEGLVGSLEGLQCLLLQSDFYINTGNLRKVWLILRRAVSLAQMLGLHRQDNTDVNATSTQRRVAVWSEVWQKERGFSMILGLPCATIESQAPRLEFTDVQPSIPRIEMFLQRLSIVMGHLIERDQNLDGKAFSTTLKIEEELEICRMIMPLEWWHRIPDPEMTVEAILAMFTAKIRFHTTIRLLHLPFVLKVSESLKYQSSRLASLESSRQIINAYSVLRNADRPALSFCDAADFQAFTASMMLLIDLLIYSHRPIYRDQHQTEQDWQLIFGITRQLKHLSQSMKGCSVASMGANVLEDFSALRTDTIERVCKVYIPYFGKIEIQRSGHRDCTRKGDFDVEISDQEDDDENPVDESIYSILSSESYLFPSEASQPWDLTNDDWMSLVNGDLANGWDWSLNGHEN